MKIIAVLFFVLAALLVFCEAQGYGRGYGGGQMRGGQGRMGYGQGGYGGGMGYGQPNYLGGGMMGGRGGGFRG